jgi:hypothetical protein
MPMGIKNALTIHQHWVSIAQQPWIGKICCAYIDNITIWSHTLEEHELNVRTILKALADNSLYCNPKKTKLFSTKICFLRHCISVKGIMPDYRIFVTTDHSNTGSGAILAFGPSYNLTHLVAYKSCSFKGAKLNYLVHEKELLAIVHTLAKWCSELLRYQFQQCNMSRQQACWMELLSQYKATIHYLPGENNCTADMAARPSPYFSIASLLNAKGS